jgi:hypothetical protein
MVRDITPAQLADTSTISPAAKAIFPDWRNAVTAIRRDYANALRQYGGTTGARRANFFTTTTMPAYDQNDSNLYNGLITWGEYNRRRQEIAREFQSTANNLSS